MRAKYIALMRTADRVEAACKHIKARIGRYTVIQVGTNKYEVWSGPEWLATINKLSDACMFATLQDDEDRRRAA